ncbi:low affinity immunoglobulin epsilon Fc receptor-like [Pomacea canaliculata]|uniref:low affinity immunoglobulin epsilon Fc receptor-like n=1 Tax=Pomacea canaliculata TaxID=400727 RepID=UPI000D73EBB8|nr:low affinity immunoglobulin epsilon Fc receptor-like [Pomacea canaliculata]
MSTMKGKAVVTTLLLSLLALSEQQCPRSWTQFEESCYIMPDQAVTWLEAKELCLEIGGHMVEVDSADENNFLLSIIKNHGATSSWIGLEDFAEEGHFVWSSSQRVPSYTNWAPHVPDDINGNQDCGWITNHPAWWAAGLWDDGYCTDKFNVICERSQ